MAILKNIHASLIPPRTINIANFLGGIFIENGFANGLCYGLNYKVIPKGIENSYGAVNKEMLRTSWTSKKKETSATINFFRKEPDLTVVSPSGEPMMIEIKSRSINALESHLNNCYFTEELEEIFSMYKHTRVVYIDVQKRKICSISGLDERDIEGQLDHWYKPWTWLEGVNSEEDFVRWSNAYLFDPLHQAAIKIANKCEG